MLLTCAIFYDRILCTVKNRKEKDKMKTGIHPDYKEVTIRCACGETVTTRSTKGDANGEIRVEVCSKCHPFFTGKQKFVDAGGRVDKFKKRLEAANK